MRLAQLLPLLLLLTLAPSYAAPQPPHHKRTEEALTPLAVTLSSIEPAVVPKQGPITISGTVTNRSQETWRQIKVYPFASSGPITARSSLEAALGTSEGSVVGHRFFDDQQAVATIGDLAVGQSAAFQLVLPKRILPIPSTPGVYWIGAHALGANARGNDSLSDGRARTFITQAATRQPSTPVALVLPVRANAERTAEGRVEAEKRWSRLVSPGGRLDRLEGLLASAASQSVNLLIDPNVTDVVANVAAGNPPAQLGGPSTKGGDQRDPMATEWLDQFRELAQQQFAWRLPYADPDVAALARTQPDVLRAADQLAALSLEARQIPAKPMLAPGDGSFDGKLLTRIGAATLLVDSDTTDEPLSSTDYAAAGGAHLVFADELIANGGPDGGTTPNNPYDALGLRQLILATAFLQQDLVKPGADIPTLVVNLPRLWDPGTGWRAANFFSGLRQPWLRLVSLPTTGKTRFSGTLEHAADIEVPAENVAVARKGVRQAKLFGDLLSEQNNARLTFAGAALAATSYDARNHPRLTRKSAETANAWVTGELDKVAITGNDFVTLSGGTGPVSVSIVNGMDHPIEVGLKPITTSPKVVVKVPDPVRLEPGQRASVKVQIETSTVGVQQIGLAPATTQGQVLGEPFTFNLRTSQVGLLIWVIMFAGAGLLLVMIIRRIIRRVRTRSWRLEHGSELDAETGRGEASDVQQH